MNIELQVTDSSKELAFEIQKQQLIIEHHKSTIEQKDKEIGGLKEIIRVVSTI